MHFYSPIDFLFGESAGEFEYQPYALVPEVYTFAVHHRACTGDHAYIVLMTVINSRLRDTGAIPDGLVNPNIADSGFTAIVNDLICDFRPGDDHHSLNAVRD